MQENPKAGPEVSRRGFLKGAAIAGVSAVIPSDKISTAVETKDEPALGNFQAPKRPLGKTGLECSILGMGGFRNQKQYRSPMPAMGRAQLTPDQVSAVAAYVWSLSHWAVRGSGKHVDHP